MTNPKSKAQKEAESFKYALGDEEYERLLNAFRSIEICGARKMREKAQKLIDDKAFTEYCGDSCLQRAVEDIGLLSPESVVEG